MPNKATLRDRVKFSILNAELRDEAVSRALRFAGLVALALADRLEAGPPRRSGRALRNVTATEGQLGTEDQQ